MREMSSAEKLALVRHQGQTLAKVGTDRRPTRRELIELAQRVIELAWAIPDQDLGVEFNEAPKATGRDRIDQAYVVPASASHGPL